MQEEFSITQPSSPPIFTKIKQKLVWGIQTDLSSDSIIHSFIIPYSRVKSLRMECKSDDNDKASSKVIHI